MQIFPSFLKGVIASEFFRSFAGSSISAVSAGLKYTPWLTSGCVLRELFCKAITGSFAWGSGGTIKQEKWWQTMHSNLLALPSSLRKIVPACPRKASHPFANMSCDQPEGRQWRGKLSGCTREQRGTVISLWLITKLLQVFIVKLFFFWPVLSW